MSVQLQGDMIASGQIARHCSHDPFNTLAYATDLQHLKYFIAGFWILSKLLIDQVRLILFCLINLTIQWEQTRVSFYVIVMCAINSCLLYQVFHSAWLTEIHAWGSELNLGIYLSCE